MAVCNLSNSLQLEIFSFFRIRLKILKKSCFSYVKLKYSFFQGRKNVGNYLILKIIMYFNYMNEYYNTIT
jgi:hypothetical protein